MRLKHTTAVRIFFCRLIWLSSLCLVLLNIPSIIWWIMKSTPRFSMNTITMIKPTRLAYDPAMLLKVVLFAYSRGITSSRKIEKACWENVIFMALSADSQPHFTTITDFISRMHRPVGELFLQILMVCDQLDLIGKDMFAIDGRKIMGWFAPPNRLQRAILVSTSKTATDRTTHVYFSPRYRYWQEQFSSFR